MPTNAVLLERSRLVRKSPEEIDIAINKHIDQATAEDADIWTKPKDFAKRDYLRCFFQYPAMMVPAVQKKLIEIVLQATNNGEANIIDPFMGSATSLVSCMEHGVNCYGQDINPLAILLAKARTGPYYTKALKESYDLLMERVNRDRSNVIEANFPTLNKWFKPEISIELSKLVRAIRAESNPTIRRFFWVILAETVRVTSNDRTSTFKMHIRSADDIKKRKLSAISVFELHIERSMDDYEEHANKLVMNGRLNHNGTYNSNIEIVLKNTKEGVHNPSNAPFYDLLVTSPPYGDNHTTVPYGQHSYLPLQWIDLADIDPKASKDFIKNSHTIDGYCLGGVKAKLDKAKFETLLQISPTLNSTYKKIVTNAARLAKTTDKTKGRDKINKVMAFMLDINTALENIFAVMKPNSYQIWTVGNRTVAGIEIPNSEIITELIFYRGGILVKKLERDIISKRMANRNNSSDLMTTEDILIFRKIRA